jgi:hypothetical protein
VARRQGAALGVDWERALEAYHRQVSDSPDRFVRLPPVSSTRGWPVLRRRAETGTDANDDRQDTISK